MVADGNSQRPPHDPTFALFLGGRSGSGKSSVAYEIHDQLSSSGVMHACIEGDNLDHE